MESLLKDFTICPQRSTTPLCFSNSSCVSQTPASLILISSGKFAFFAKMLHLYRKGVHRSRLGSTGLGLVIHNGLRQWEFFLLVFLLWDFHDSFNSLISYHCSSGVCFSPLHFFNLFLLLSDLAQSRSWILYLWPSFLSSSRPTYPHGTPHFYLKVVTSTSNSACPPSLLFFLCFISQSMAPWLNQARNLRVITPPSLCPHSVH